MNFKFFLGLCFAVSLNVSCATDLGRTSQLDQRVEYGQRLLDGVRDDDYFYDSWSKQVRLHRQRGIIDNGQTSIAPRSWVYGDTSHEQTTIDDEVRALYHSLLESATGIEISYRRPAYPELIIMSSPVKFVETHLNYGHRVIVMSDASIFLSESKDELAFKLGHEIAHSYLRQIDSDDQAPNFMLGSLIGVGTLVATGGVSGLATYLVAPFLGYQIDKAAQHTVHSFRIDQELAADKFSIDLMAKAGYNPDAAFVAISKTLADDNVSNFRAARMRSLVAYADDFYEAESARKVTSFNFETSPDAATYRKKWNILYGTYIPTLTEHLQRWNEAEGYRDFLSLAKAARMIEWHNLEASELFESKVQDVRDFPKDEIRFLQIDNCRRTLEELDDYYDIQLGRDIAVSMALACGDLKTAINIYNIRQSPKLADQLRLVLLDFYSGAQPAENVGNPDAFPYPVSRLSRLETADRIGEYFFGKGTLEVKAHDWTENHFTDVAPYFANLGEDFQQRIVSACVAKKLREGRHICNGPSNFTSSEARKNFATQCRIVRRNPQMRRATAFDCPSLRREVVNETIKSFDYDEIELIGVALLFPDWVRHQMATSL